MRGGLIHSTFQVDTSLGRWVLQRVHPMFPPEVQNDLMAVTRHLVACGVATPELIRTRRGELASRSPDGGVWRLLTFVPGRTLERSSETAQIRSAGSLVGRFHTALASLGHRFVAPRRVVHDPAAHRAGLLAALADRKGHPAYGAVEAVGQQIVAVLNTCEPLPLGPEVVVHGDLKLSNVRFAERGPEAVALLDLDTVGPGVVAVELGDALRSWCNPAGEDSAHPRFSLASFVGAMRGYQLGTPGCDTQRLGEAALAATETIAAELAARFCRDALEESYFGWDPSRFASASAHNLLRARGQLALARLVARQRASALAELRQPAGDLALPGVRSSDPGEEIR